MVINALKIKWGKNMATGFLMAMKSKSLEIFNVLNSLQTIGFLMVSNFEKEHWLNEYHVSFTP